MVLPWVSPLGPVLANLFYELLWTLSLTTFRECEIFLYRRYVDGIIWLFNCELDAYIRFEFLNTQHLLYIYITLNLYLKNKLINKFHFHVLIRNDGDQLIYWLLRFYTFFLQRWLVRTLLHPDFMISSNWFLFHKEFVEIKYYLENDSYPLSFVNK